ncbi:hypothetical protein QTG56_25950 (plasmid) [Rossellomorea sp. AcN35-11]|nr:hypothetical protein [Rossellomorea aquimaris]WJV32061.1 hypothetical protein QTG56_25950 [Rossellomorea sp. AcN35-11]
MSQKNVMKRLFNLFLVYLKTDDVESKETLKYEIDLLHEELDKDESISLEKKQLFKELLRQYKVMYESDDLVEKAQAEEEVKKLILQHNG